MFAWRHKFAPLLDEVDKTKPESEKVTQRKKLNFFNFERNRNVRIFENVSRHHQKSDFQESNQSKC